MAIHEDRPIILRGLDRQVAASWPICRRAILEVGSGKGIQRGRWIVERYWNTVDFDIEVSGLRWRMGQEPANLLKRLPREDASAIRVNCIQRVGRRRGETRNIALRPQIFDVCACVKGAICGNSCCIEVPKRIDCALPNKPRHPRRRTNTATAEVGRSGCTRSCGLPGLEFSKDAPADQNELVNSQNMRESGCASRIDTMLAVEIGLAIRSMRHISVGGGPAAGES